MAERESEGRERERGGKGGGSCKFKARHNIFYPSRVFRYQRDANNFGKSPRDFAPLLRLALPCMVLGSNRLSTIIHIIHILQESSLD